MTPTLDGALADLVRSWAKFWPDAEIGAVAADVRARTDAAISAWALDEVQVLDGGNVALVLAARRHGRGVVAKVSPRGVADSAELAGQGVALAFWQPTGAVPRLEELRDDGLTLLMERLVPGEPLDATAAGEAKRLQVLGELVARLHAAGSPPPGLAHIGGDYARSWRAALGTGPVDELAAPQATDVLLHADLHGANALRHDGEWRAIDPHAVRGDRHADVWALIDPLAPALPADDDAALAQAWARVERYCAAAALQPARAAAWVRLRARAEAHEAESHAPQWARRLRRMARSLEP